MRGPIDFIVVSFAGSKFDGKILNALTDALDKGIIGLVSLAVISKDHNGIVRNMAINDIGDEYVTEFSQKYPGDPTPVDQADIDEVGSLLEKDTSAGFLAIEHLWAKPLKQALIDANGVLVADGRIHPDALMELSQG